MATATMLSGSVYTILEKNGKPVTLGRGGQGVVYKVRKDGRDYALKMYTGSVTDAFLDNLILNVSRGAPSSAFIWPKDLYIKGNRCGYIMDLYDADYATLAEVVKNSRPFPNRRIQLLALLNLVDSFDKLHARGDSYQDLNDGGVRFDTVNGKVSICDNDNVAPYGRNHGINGLGNYRAPEVAIGLYQPDKHSDLFSMALLLFLVLCHAFPYDGKMRLECMTTAANTRRIYGTDPVFIFDPNDDSNRPDPQVDKNAISFWKDLPEFIQELFIKTFTAGMPRTGMQGNKLRSTRQCRTTDAEWKAALLRWLNTSTNCPHCGKSICCDVENGAVKPMKCSGCNRNVVLSLPVLKTSMTLRPGGGTVIILNEGKKVSMCSVVANGDINEVALEVVRSTKGGRPYGIRNHLNNDIRLAQEGVAPYLVEPGKTGLVLDGVDILFNNDYSGKITYK